MGMRRLFIIRKDLNLSAGKLAAMVGHCCEAYWTNFLKKHITRRYTNMFPCERSNPLKVRDRIEERKVQLYRRDDLCTLSMEAFDAGKSYFLAHMNDKGIFVKDEELAYEYCLTESPIDKEIYENYINDSFVKTICEAKNLNHLMKVVEKAKELGFKENLDYGLINDKCLTELNPENEDGTCTIGVWFKPLNDDIAHELSKKYQLYKSH